MKKPARRGSAIDLKRYQKWVNEFANYRHQIPEARIRAWIEQFEVEHHDIAARILDSVDFINNGQIRAAFRTMLDSLPGWDRSPSNRVGKWRFAPYTTSSGESGDSMMHVFRHANNMASTQFNDLFIYRSQLLSERLGAEDTVVLVDDMVGSGDQVCTAWTKSFSELLTEVGTVYLVVVAACDSAVQRIADETNISLMPHIHLNNEDNIFHSACMHFNKQEKDTILKYCEYVDKNKPMGHGDTGLVVVFSHSIPNNSIPVLAKTTPRWDSLFRRYD